MQKVWSTIRNTQQGFSSIEALLAATVFAMLVTGLIGAIIYGRSATSDANTHNRATFLAEEGIEATRNIANAAYSNLSNGTYGLAQSGGVWTLSGSSDTSDIYTRQITIADAGTNRKQVTSVVSWVQPSGDTVNVTLTSRIANWEAAFTPQTSWPNGILAGSLDLSGTVDAVKVATVGNYAYVIRGSGTGNFSVVNISNPASPSLVGSLTLTGTPTNIDVSGNYAYVTNTGDTTEFQVVNISNPAAPTLAKTLDLTGTADATGVDVSGNYAYVTRAFSSTTGSYELTILDITTPTAPTVKGGYNHGSVGLNEVYVYNNYAYVVTTSTNPMMLSINATNPASPTLAGSYSPALTFSNALTITGYGSTVYIAYGTNVDSVNVTNPAAPTQLGSISPVFGGGITDLTIDSTGKYLFAGSTYTFGQFMIFNVSNPASMVSSKILTLSGNVNGVAYNPTLDIVVGASASDTQEVMTFTKN